MNYYKKKQYKKFHMNENYYDELRESSIEGYEYINNDSVFTDNEESIFLNEPDIVKELRSEEREGKLFSSLDEEQEIPNVGNTITRRSNENETQTKTYHDVFLLAKKALKDIDPPKMRLV